MSKTKKLNAAFETGDRRVICDALFATIHDIDTFSAFAIKAGVERATLYTALKHNLRFDIFLKVVQAADFKLVVTERSGLRLKPSLTHAHFSRAFRTQDVTLIVEAFNEFVRTQEKVAVFAQKVNMDRRRIYRTFAYPHVPRLDIVLQFLKAIDLGLAVKRSNVEGSRSASREART
jgi:DNA-binding phage protein